MCVWNTLLNHDLWLSHTHKPPWTTAGILVTSISTNLCQPSDPFHYTITSDTPLNTQHPVSQINTCVYLFTNGPWSTDKNRSYKWGCSLCRVAGQTQRYLRKEQKWGGVRRYALLERCGKKSLQMKWKGLENGTATLRGDSNLMVIWVWDDFLPTEASRAVPDVPLALSVMRWYNVTRLNNALESGKMMRWYSRRWSARGKCRWDVERGCTIHSNVHPNTCLFLRD